MDEQPAVSVLQLDVDLAQAEMKELLLLGALGDLGPDE
jgi:hypothetical protein